MLKRSVRCPEHKISYRSQIQEHLKCNVSSSFSSMASLVYPKNLSFVLVFFPPHPNCPQPLWALFPWGLWSSRGHLSSHMPNNTVPDTQALNKHLWNEFWNLNKEDYDVRRKNTSPRTKKLVSWTQFDNNDGNCIWVLMTTLYVPNTLLEVFKI